MSARSTRAITSAAVTWLSRSFCPHSVSVTLSLMVARRPSATFSVVMSVSSSVSSPAPSEMMDTVATVVSDTSVVPTGGMIS